MKSNKLVCEDWVLYDFEYIGEIATDPYTSQEYADISMKCKSLRVFGTNEQLRNLSENYNIDEVFKYESVRKNSYWDGIVCGDRPDRLSRKDYNKKVKTKYREYTLLYKLNDNQPVILKTL